MYWILKQKDSQIVSTYCTPAHVSKMNLYLFAFKGLSHEMDLAFDDMYG
jgi:hypothetical protein